MYYSITFTDSEGVSKNTWSDWHLIPVGPPMIAPPEPYTNYVEIPGRQTGPLDLSEALTGRPTFQNSEGSWTFILADDYWTRMSLYNELKQYLHGRRLKIMLEEDEMHYYEGRINISEPSTGNGQTQFTLDYTVSPVRYEVSGDPEGI